MRPRSEPGLDVLRGVLVLGMFVVHARRLQPGRTRGAGLGDRLLEACMWAEPFIAAGFLFLVGVSLVLSRSAFVARGQGSWMRKLTLRAAGIYALAIVLFVPQYGLELPDLIASPGILSAIAIAIGVVGCALAAPRAELVLVAITIAGLGVTALLDRTGASVSGINAGPGGALPLVSVSALGALCLTAQRRWGTRAVWLGTLAALPILVFTIASGARWTTERASQYAVQSGLLALPDLFEAPSLRSPVWFWNHSALGALALLVPIGCCLGLALSLPRKLADLRAFSTLGLLGRHALAAYVLHLGLLGVVELVERSPKSAFDTWLLVAGLGALSLLLAYGLDRRTTASVSAAPVRSARRRPRRSRRRSRDLARLRARPRDACQRRPARSSV